jgi:DNA invertase Pin-like site-specific DNA recombinase
LEKENKTFVKVRYFVCTEESRISRADNLMDTLMLDTKIRETGVDIIYTFGNVDTSTDEGKLLNQFKFIIASEERKRIKKRAITGKVERLRLGYWPFPCVPV